MPYRAAFQLLSKSRGRSIDGQLPLSIRDTIALGEVMGFRGDDLLEFCELVHEQDGAYLDFHAGVEVPTHVRQQRRNSRSGT
jgi:hypothetical protein